MNEFGHPEYIAGRAWLIAGLALVLALGLQQWLAHRKAYEGGLSRRFGPGLALWRVLLKWALLSAAGWHLLTALAVPLGEPIKMESESQGADLILAVDVSSSMYAQDIRPNRIMALKQAMAGFFSRLQGDRIGLVAFAGEAVIACPLTSDYETAALFLEKLESDSVPRDGTGLDKALKLCLDGFSADPKRGRLIVLASDGEDTLDTDTAAEARRAQEMGVPVYTLGIGTAAGGMIPDRPDIFGRVRAKMYQGRPVVTRLNPATLSKIAGLSGGQYFEGASPAALNAAYERIRALKQGLAKSPDRYVRDPLYQEALWLAIVLLLLEMMLSMRGGGWARAWHLASKRLAALRSRGAVTAALLLLAPCLGAFSLDPGRREHDQGNALYREGKHAEAAEMYQRSLSETARASAHYNLGNAKFMQEDFDGAISAFEEALRLDPSDADALHNLELAKRRQQRRENGEGKESKPGDKKDGQQKDAMGGKQGRQQGSKPGQQAQPGQGQKGQQGQASELNQEQIQAMMNMLKNDQKRFGQAFQPMKKYDRQPESQDPMEELFEQMTGRPMRQKQAESQGGVERKDW